MLVLSQNRYYCSIMNLFSVANIMKAITSVLILSFLIASCSTTPQEQSKLTKKLIKAEKINNQELSSPTSLKEIPIKAHLVISRLDSSIMKDVRILSKKYVATPFFMTIAGQNLYITCSQSSENIRDRFDGTLKYGLVNGTLVELAKPIYDKIYNPNLTLQNCFEVKKGTKVGLINYETGAILNPQYDYILPSSNIATEVAYGLKNEKWFEIKSSDITNQQVVDFNPIPILNKLSFSLSEVGENMMVELYGSDMDISIEAGVVLIPSYLEQMEIFNRNEYMDFILADPMEIPHMGTEGASLTTDKQKSISERIISFFVTVGEYGIDARGYNSSSKRLIVFDQEKKTFNSMNLRSEYGWNELCREYGYRFVNDSVIEIKKNNSDYNSEVNIYDFETKYTYHTISKEGNILKLSSNRYFDFTKFTYIDKSHFEGCFANRLDVIKNDRSNMELSDHLSKADMDLMRNEIFADYGYKFKTEKWQKYFSSKVWYKPRFDDVNDQLSEMDKENIKIILKVQQLLEKDEQKYLNKRSVQYYPAG